jgi:DNA-binding XRE family transcriptional regulator
MSETLAHRRGTETETCALDRDALERIRAECRATTLEELADMAGISRSTLIRWRDGDGNPTLRKARTLRRRLSVLTGRIITLDELFPSQDPS